MKSRRYGRQIPADMMMLSIVSLSLILGLPVARRLHLVYPGISRWAFLLVGWAVGFLSLLLIIGVLNGFLNLLSRFWKNTRSRK